LILNNDLFINILAFPAEINNEALISKYFLQVFNPNYLEATILACINQEEGKPPPLDLYLKFIGNIVRIKIPNIRENEIHEESYNNYGEDIHPKSGFYHI